MAEMMLGDDENGEEGRKILHFQPRKQRKILRCETHFQHHDPIDLIAEFLGYVRPWFRQGCPCRPQTGLQVFDLIFVRGVSCKDLLFELVVLLLHKV